MQDKKRQDSAWKSGKSGKATKKMDLDLDIFFNRTFRGGCWKFIVNSLFKVEDKKLKINKWK